MLILPVSFSARWPAARCVRIAVMLAITWSLTFLPPFVKNHDMKRFTSLKETARSMTRHSRSVDVAADRNTILWTPVIWADRIMVPSSFSCKKLERLQTSLFLFLKRSALMLRFMQRKNSPKHNPIGV